MATVLCSPALWRFVRAWRCAGGAPPGRGSSGVFGPWTATTIPTGRCEIVMAVEHRTYMALVCDLGAEATFRAAWNRSLLTAFEDMQVPIARVAPAACTPPLFEPLKDERFTAILAAVEFVCRTELHYCSDLRVIQRRLNEFPHDHPPDYAPIAAVRRLFGIGP